MPKKPTTETIEETTNTAEETATILEAEETTAEPELTPEEKAAAELAAQKAHDEELVYVNTDRAMPGDDPSIPVMVNGRSFLLPAGERVQCPRFIAEEYERSREAQRAYDRKQAAMAKEAADHNAQQDYMINSVM